MLLNMIVSRNVFKCIFLNCCFSSFSNLIANMVGLMAQAISRLLTFNNITCFIKILSGHQSQLHLDLMELHWYVLVLF